MMAVTATGPLVSYTDNEFNFLTGNTNSSDLSNIKEVTTNDAVSFDNIVHSLDSLIQLQSNPPNYGNDFVSIFGDVSKPNINAIKSRSGGYYSSHPFGQYPGNSGTYTLGGYVGDDILSWRFALAQGEVRRLCSLLGVPLRPGMEQDVIRNGVIQANVWNSLILNARDCMDNRFDGIDLSSVNVRNGPTFSESTRFGHGLFYGHVVNTFWFNFSTLNNMEAFFNRGGSIGLRFQAPDFDRPLNRVFNLTNEIRLSAFQINAPILNEEDGITSQIRYFDDISGSTSSSGLLISDVHSRVYDCRSSTTSSRPRRIYVDVGLFNLNSHSSIVIEVVYASLGIDIGSNSFPFPTAYGPFSITGLAWEPTQFNYLDNINTVFPTIRRTDGPIISAPNSFRRP